MARYSHLIAFLLLQLLISASSANSQDRVFNYTYQTTVLSPGQFEFEVWNTLRWGRESYYQRLDQRFEFETGIARNLQTAFYVNLKSSSSSHSSGSVPATVELESETELSFSNEWKFKLLDPVADPFGVALYAEYSLSTLGVEFEPRVIVDKVLDRTIIAFNASAEFESETEIEPDGTEARKKEAEVDLNLAAAVRMCCG